MKRVIKEEERVQRGINSRFFEECKANYLYERMGEHRLKILLPGYAKLEIFDDSVDFFDMSREALLIYKNKEIENQKQLYLNKYKI